MPSTPLSYRNYARRCSPVTYDMSITSAVGQGVEFIDTTIDSFVGVAGVGGVGVVGWEGGGGGRGSTAAPNTPSTSA